MRTRVVYSVIAILMVMMAVGCSTSNIGTTAGPDHSTSRFVLNVDDGSFFNGSSIEGINLTETEYDDHVVVSVNAEGAQDLKALYFTLEYDETLYRPMRVNSTEAMGDDDDMLRLELRTIPGKVVYGQVLTHPDWREGLTGDAEVATVTFRKEACPVVKNVSAYTAPISAMSQTELVIDTDTALLTWYYYNQGDYNQDGLVNASDMTPVGQRYDNQSAGFPDDPFPPETADSATDGNDNGLIEVSDITAIGQNYENNALGGYDVYTSASTDDLPETAGGANGAGASLVATVEFSALLGSKATDRLHHEYTITSPVEGNYYWVRPMHSGTGAAGIASNAVQYTNVEAPTLALITAAIDGDGTSGNPYELNVTTDYIFTVTDPTDGDVSNDANTAYIVSDPGAGAIATADATLNVENTFNGNFYVTATYNSIASNTLYFFVDEPPEEQIWIMADSADADWSSVPSGDGSDDDNSYVVLTDTFNSDGTTEFTLAANTMQDGSGTAYDVSTLTWDAEPPFIVNWTSDATFTAHYDDSSGTPNSFCHGSIYAEDTEMERSQNDLWIKSELLPSS